MAARRATAADGGTVVVSARLFSELVGIAVRTRTKLGHRVQVVTQESLGECSARHGCSRMCLDDWDTLHEAIDVLEAATEPVALQPDLFEGVAG